MEGKFIQRIVREAEKLLSRDFAVYAKGSEGDLVTDVDYLVERFLIEKIQAEYPDFAIISEEFNADTELSDNCFIIDPIDGTKNFANGLPLWGIQVACRKNGQTIASVISMPALKEFYFADESGAYLNGRENFGARSANPECVLCGDWRRCNRSGDQNAEIRFDSPRIRGSLRGFCFSGGRKNARGEISSRKPLGL